MYIFFSVFSATFTYWWLGGTKNSDNIHIDWHSGNNKTCINTSMRKEMMMSNPDQFVFLCQAGFLMLLSVFIVDFALTTVSILWGG